MATLIKSNNGCLYGRNNNGDFTNPFETTAHWDINNPTAFVASLVGGVLKFYQNAVVVVHDVIVNNQVSPVSKSYIYTVIDSSALDNTSGPVNHVDGVSYPNLDDIELIARRNTIPANRFMWHHEYYTGGYNQMSKIASIDVDGSQHKFWLFSDGSDSIGYDDILYHDWSGTTVDRTSGKVGLYFNGQLAFIQIHDYIVMSDRYITINGLESGDSVEIRKSDTTVIDSASEVAGVATIDIHKVTITDIYKIVVVRAAADYASYTTSSGNYIVGGDVYIVSQDITPTGIISTETFGVSSVVVQIQEILLNTGITSEEAFGTHVITTLTSILPSSISSEEAFGNAIVHPIFDLLVNSISSEEDFGTATIFVATLQFIYPYSIPSEEVFYNNYIYVETPCVPYFYHRQEGTINSVVSGPLIDCNILPFPLRVRLYDWEVFDELSQRKIGLGIESNETFGLPDISHG